MTDRTEELRSSGAVTAEGRLHVDADLARAKLRKFRLPDPHMYVLQFVRAASVLGAEFIEFSIRATVVEVTFDATLSGDTLRNIWSVAFGERREPEQRAARHIALGIGAMQAFDPASIMVESDRLRWTLRGDEESYDAVSSSPRGKTRIVLTERLGLRRLGDFFTRVAGDPMEVHVLRKYCRSARMRVGINGYAVNRPLAASHLTRYRERRNRAEVGLRLSAGGGELSRRMVLGLRADFGTQPLTGIRILKSEVEVDSMELPLHAQPAVGRVDAPEIVTDLSGLEPSNDAEYLGLVRRLGFEAYHAALARWVTEDATDDQKRALLDELAQWSAEWEFGELPAASVELIDALMSTPLWRRSGGPSPPMRVPVVRVTIEDHPDADRLEIARCEDRQAVVPIGTIQTGDLVAFIGEGAVVPRPVLEELGLVGRLGGPDEDRVEAIKLRGVRSDGLCYRARDGWEEGDDVATELGVTAGRPPDDLGEPISMTEVIRQDQLPYTDQRYVDVSLPDGPCLRRVPFLSAQTLRRLADVRGLQLVNRTEAFERETRRRRNIARWEARPLRRDPPYEYCREVRLGDRVGFVYLPVDEWGELRSDPVLRIFVKGRLLVTRELPPGVSFDVDGPFRTNSDFSDLDDDSAQELFRALLGEVSTVMDQFAEAVATDSFVRREHATILRRWILHGLHDDHLGEAFGITWTANRERSQLSDSLLAAPCFETYRGGPLSAREMLGREKVHLLERRRGWQELAELAGDEPEIVLADPEDVNAYVKLLGYRFHPVTRSSLKPPTKRAPVDEVAPQPRAPQSVEEGEETPNDDPAPEETPPPEPQFGESEDTPPPDLPRWRAPVLRAVAETLREARGPHGDLIGDDLLGSIRWAEEPAPGDPVCGVTAEGVTLRRDAAIVESIDRSDATEVAFLASIVATETNRFYREISDFDEIEIQRRLLRPRPG